MSRDRAVGAYIGAAIGDAMGGPVECNHAARIKRLHGTITGLLPYGKPLSLIELQPGYALHPEPGSVTDDTFIRAAFTEFFLATPPDGRTPEALAQWLLDNADFRYWWPPMVEPLRRIERGDVTPEQAGLEFREGGGIGWWTAAGILHAGDPRPAADECRRLCPIWKGPLEQDLTAGVQAALAEGMADGATVASMLDALLAQCRSLGTKLLERAIRIAREAGSQDELTDALYREVLVGEPPVGADDPLPPSLKPLQDSDEPYAECYFAEQIPLTVAAFVFEEGRPSAIPCACMLGRDADSVATTVGSWVGALHGECSLPADWVEPVCRVNLREIDIRAQATRLAGAS
jgi:ADP-ribosylglycohydrolase